MNTTSSNFDGQEHRGTYKVEQVFTPNQHANVNFVSRPELEDRVCDALRTPGKQLVVFGHSGSGKSSLLNRKLNELYPDHITTRCQESMSFETALLDAFDQLDRFYTTQTEASKTSSRTVALEAQYSALKASIEKGAVAHQQMTLHRILPPQLTPQRLAQFLGDRGLCWVLEDFHKIRSEEKRHLSQALKVFVDESSTFDTVRVVAIGAVATAREVVEFDPEMRTRVAEIYVPLMSDAELRAVLVNGETLLNIRIDGWIEAEIVRYSAGLASICHQLALNLCRAAHVNDTCATTQTLSKTHLDAAINRYVEDSSDSLKAAFEKALRRERVRKFDNTRLILTSLARASDDGLTTNAILVEIRKEAPDYPQGNLTTYLRDLQGEAKGKLLRCDRTSGKFSFSDPLYHAYARVLLVPSNQDTIFEGTLLDALRRLSQQLTGNA